MLMNCGNMKLGVSNLAWDNNINLDDLIVVFKNNNINYIEIVLSKYIDWNKINLTKLNKFISYVKDNGLDILSTQSIFFNSNINNFHDVNFKYHIQNVSNICSNFGIKFIVLGAPTMRTSKINLGLIKQFTYIDKVLANNNQILLLEPNSKKYNGNYFYKISEIVDFINKNNFNNIKTMIDTHNILLEGENLLKNFLTYSSLIHHIHISEDNLGDFLESENHNELAKVLKYNNYSNLLIYEAKPSLNLTNSIELFSKTYSI
jgi:sugar phosphate isomerase/epimerase